MSEHRPSHEEIAIAAFCIYMDQGCPSGRAHEHWLQAEQSLIARAELQLTESRGTPSNPPTKRAKRSSNRKKSS